MLLKQRFLLQLFQVSSITFTCLRMKKAKDSMYGKLCGLSVPVLLAVYIIMTYGDDAGLMLPSGRLAPVQVVIVPIWKKDNDKNEVLDAALSIKNVLHTSGIKVKLDDSDQRTPGWKFSFWEMKVRC